MADRIKDFSEAFTLIFSPSMIQEHLDFLMLLALRAGWHLNECRKQPIEKKWKARRDFTTFIDVEIDAFLRKEIEHRYPQYSIISEEAKDLDKGSPVKVVIDPIDGTIPYTTFINEHWGVCLGICFRCVPVIGVIYAPGRNQLYYAALGFGAFMNGEKIHVSDETDVNHVLMGMDPGKENKGAYVPYIERLMKPDGIITALQGGCASGPMCFVTEGKIHAYLATSLNPEDMAAAAIIAREAGAAVTTVDGREWLLGEPSILMANPTLHEKLLKMFQEGK